MPTQQNKPPVNEMIKRYREQRALLVRTIKVQWLIILALVIGLIVAIAVKGQGKVNATDAALTTLPSFNEIEDTYAPTTKAPDTAAITHTLYVSTQEPELEPQEQYISLGEYKLTAYCSCKKCCGSWASNRPTDSNGEPIVITASGARAIKGITIAVDPNIIPYGTEVVIEGHTFIAQDTGAACRNGKLIDIYFASHEAAIQFGVQYAEIFIKTN